MDASSTAAAVNRKAADDGKGAERILQEDNMQMITSTGSLGRNALLVLFLLVSASGTIEPAAAGCSAGRNGNCYDPKIGTDYGNGTSAKSRTDTSSGMKGHVLKSEKHTFHGYVLKAQTQKHGRCRNC